MDGWANGLKENSNISVKTEKDQGYGTYHRKLDRKTAFNIAVN